VVAMSDEVIQLRGTDFDECMDFLNEVFSEHAPHDFAAMLPSIYQPTDEQMACNYAIRVDGKLAAVVGLFPAQWQVGDQVLKVGGIGGVSTHKRMRGAGYMKTLMNHCVGVMQKEQYHLSWLGGQRQRYGYFGYETCGVSTNMSLSPTNLRHALPETAITCSPIEANDDCSLAFAHRLHAHQSVHCQRPADVFHRFLVGGFRRPYLARDETDTAIGYLVARRGEVTEWVAEDDDHAIAMAGAWVRDRGEQANFWLMPTQTGLAQRLGALAESTAIRTSGNWQVFDWAATIGALLQVQAAEQGLPDGRVRFGIEGYGVLEIDVENDRICCRRTEASASVVWHPFEAMRALFGPLPAHMVVNVSPELSALHGWCPLPLGWSHQDYV
ncbi:MAG: GNAT family N-acetyltransferase, partial [Candidatus Latescibacterota bacterium]|nr:GNAT family N-acetyltransferase [Candidatus Latescibacterota bacterium]